MKTWAWCTFCGYCLLISSTTNSLHASEESLYDFLWLDPDKSVYVLQKKLYQKAKKFSLGGSFINSFGEEFMDTYGLDIKADYFFKEEWGVEVFYTKYSNSKNDNYRNVDVALDGVPFVRRVNQAVGAMVLWSPFYGKVNTFNRIYYFDWQFGLGLASLATESNKNSVGTSVDNYDDKQNFVALAYKTDFRFHLSRKSYLSIGVRNFNYQAEGPTQRSQKKWRDHWDLLIGYGYKF